MPRELGPSDAHEVVNSLRPGWDSWPQTAVLPRGYGVHIWGYYNAPEMARLKYGIMLFGIPITFIAFSSVADTKLGYYPAVIASIALFLFLQFSNFLKARFDITVTPATFAVAGRFSRIRSFDRSLEHGISIEPHRKGLREQSSERSTDKFASLYRESVEVVFRSLEQRVVLASFYRDPASAERLHKRVFEMAKAFS